MKNIVTVVPDDKIIIINGTGYIIEMAYPEEIHAIQWRGESGHIEYNDTRHNVPLSPDDYAEHVQPYVDIWQVAHDAATQPPPEPTLEDVAAAKLAAIQAEKIRARDAGFMVDGVLFDSDQSARISYAELALRLASDPTFVTPWKASAGTWVEMNAVKYAQVASVGGAHIQSVFAWQAARDAEVTDILAGEGTDTEKAEAIQAMWVGYELPG